MNGLEINDCGVVIDGEIVLLDYDHKEFSLIIDCADFGDYLAYSHNLHNKKGMSGECGPLTERYEWEKICLTEEEVLDHVISKLEGRDKIPIKHLIEIKKEINLKRNEQLTLF
jgi:hypothetical protein